MKTTVTKPKRDRAEYMKAYRAEKRQERADAKVRTPSCPESCRTLRTWCASGRKRPYVFRVVHFGANPLVIDPWQRDFLADALAPGIQRAGLSVSRKNGKSGLIAALFLAYLVGPLNQPEWRGLCGVAGLEHWPGN